MGEISIQIKKTANVEAPFVRILRDIRGAHSSGRTGVFVIFYDEG